jgi:diaminopimelate decarboxylase
MDPKEKEQLLSLAEKNRTPFFVSFLQKPPQRLEELRKAFGRIANEAEICFSVKTNSNQNILEALAKNSAGMEVVSRRELMQVQPFKTAKIFNSIACTEEELELALRQNALIIIDSFSQAELLQSKIGDKQIEVGLRVRFSSSKFGFSPNEVKEAVQKLEEMNLIVSVIHSHCGTNVSLRDYQNFITKLAVLVNDLPELRGIDIGGGIPGPANLRMRKQSLNDYASIVKEKLGSFLKERTLYLEVGRFLAEDSTFLVAKITHIKEADGKKLAVLDVGINVLSKIIMSPFFYIPLTENGEKKRPFKLVGPLMFGADKLGQIVGNMGAGDFVAVENVGAYCAEFAWNLSYDVPKTIELY